MQTGLLPLLALLTLLCACSAIPPQHSAQELQARQQAFIARNNTEYDQLLNTMYQRMALEAENPDASFDVLVIHGGGLAGGFAAGVINAWAQLPAPYQLPEFDLVAGASSGAVAAPFIFANSDHHRATAKTIATRPPFTLDAPGLFAFWPGNSGIISTQSLEAGLLPLYNAALANEIRAAHEQHRSLLIGVTSLDMGLGRAWQVSAEMNAPDAAHRLQQVVKASSAIPIALPAVRIDGELYTDGGVSSTLFTGFDRYGIESLAQRWQKQFPNRPMPKLRTWVIVNQKLVIDPQAIANEYPDIGARSLNIMMEYDRQKALLALATLHGEMNQIPGVNAEFRYLTIPPHVTLNDDITHLHNYALMDAIYDAGFQLGSNPTSWQQGSPDIYRLNTRRVHQVQ